MGIDPCELGVVLTSTIVGGELSLAPGVALAQKMGGAGTAAGGITAVFFGDGAACEGILHESVNLAVTWQLPRPGRAPWTVTLAAQRDSERREAVTYLGSLLAVLLLLAPAAPHITAELWSRRGAASGAPGRHVHEEPWPVPDADLLVEDAVIMVVQVAGKVRDRIEVPADADEETCRALALASEKVRTQLGDAEPRKVIVRPPKLVNIVP